MRNRIVGAGGILNLCKEGKVALLLDGGSK